MESSGKKATAADPWIQRPVWKVDAATQRLSDVRFLPSPNADGRPEAMEISLLVIHAISLPRCEFGNPEGSFIDDLFMNRLDITAHDSFVALEGLEVSAHACIFRDGSVTQYVGFDRRAWHAGVSSFRGRGRCNDFSIGIEVEGCDDRPFERAQYATLAGIVAALKAYYPAIGDDGIVGHSDIAPGRKTDPGPFFDWLRIVEGGRG